MWTDEIIDINNNLNYLVGIIEDMRVDLKDFYNLEVDGVSSESAISSNVTSIESELKSISENKYDTGKSSNDEVVRAIEKLDTSLSSLDRKMDRNNQLLTELITLMKKSK